MESHLQALKVLERFQSQKDWLMSLEIGILIVLEYVLRSIVGIPFGSIDFLRFNVLIMFSTSSGDDGFVR